ncbi:class V lanthionine synthetase subunit LxmK [Streptomyces sp. JH34]|uniref:class V lanthionine synthetase subunit LxmK n=1 Tax=Streptomyces sp. JH34 TaxID=2793633 RepID=UPI0023F9A36C|nr:class V lanthionine synthetase subunit LxmK [Streptomyces sp. JH34]MDF6019121.1 class IV lanthionine synthetase subunit LxmK [Streptomyces sp. JH34]
MAATFKPRDLDEVPSVDALLVQLGTGPFVRDTLTAPVGRNDSWVGATTSGRKVFVKHLIGPGPDVRARMGRLLSFEQFAEGLPTAALRGPAFLGADEKSSLVAYDYIEDARSGAELMIDQTFGPLLAENIGRAIGLLHEAPLTSAPTLDDSPPPHPPQGFLRGLPLPVFESLSFAELQGWRLMQTDEALVTAIGQLRERERGAPRVPSHCDLRVDQFLVTGDDFLVTDWEEFRLADPARDVGAFAGEWLHRSILDIVTTRGDSGFLDIELTHEVVLSRGVQKMQRLLPLVRSFWHGYRQVRPHLDAGLATRATAYAGWHLLDRLMAGASRASRLSGIERAAAGIGRAALINPGNFVTTLGFEEREEDVDERPELLGTAADVRAGEREAAA